MITLFLSVASYRWDNTSCCFFTAKGGLFERPKAAFIYRRGGCRHAVHDGGDGGDDTEEDSFSDSRHHRTRQGEAASSDHGFLYLFNPPYRVNR